MKYDKYLVRLVMNDKWAKWVTIAIEQPVLNALTSFRHNNPFVAKSASSAADHEEWDRSDNPSFKSPESKKY